jgi:hypothetical protein
LAPIEVFLEAPKGVGLLAVLFGMFAKKKSTGHDEVLKVFFYFKPTFVTIQM